MQILQGQIIDHYLIIKEIGSGGYGSVFLATDTRSNLKVALKIVFAHDHEDHHNRRERERLIQEIRTILSLDHPHIVKIFDYNLKSEFGAYYVMEFLEGETLEELIQRKGILPLRDVYIICQQLANVIDTIHQAGIIYRDLKTLNIFITRQNNSFYFVKVLDFGLALTPDSIRMTTAGFIVGTPEFLAPEQVTRPKHVTTRADLYSFGIILFRLLTGEYPYPGGDRMEIIRQHCMEKPQLDHPKLDESFKPLLAKLLTINPDKRYSSIREVWLELELLLLDAINKKNRSTTDPLLETFHEEIVESYSTSSASLIPCSHVPIQDDEDDELESHDSFLATFEEHRLVSKPVDERDELFLDFDEPVWLDGGLVKKILERIREKVKFLEM